MVAQPPIIEVAIEPASRADQEKLGIALAQLAADDPSLQVSTDQESGQTVLKRVSERHLDEKVEHLRLACDIALNVGYPQVAYREMLSEKVEVTYTHKKQIGAAGQFAMVTILFEPDERGSSFRSMVVGGAVPDEFVPGVEKGINSVMGSGVLAGFPVVNVRATLIGGASHDTDSSVLTFETAARSAFREALQNGGSALLEPIMKVEVVTPGEHVGLVKRDLLLRGGKILGQDARGHCVVIRAEAPLANLFGYGNTLSARTWGRGSFSMTYSHYAPVTPSEPGGDEPFPPAIGMRA